MNRTNLAQLQC